MFRQDFHNGCHAGLFRPCAPLSVPNAPIPGILFKCNKVRIATLLCLFSFRGKAEVLSDPGTLPDLISVTPLSSPPSFSPFLHPTLAKKASLLFLPHVSHGPVRGLSVWCSLYLECSSPRNLHSSLPERYLMVPIRLTQGNRANNYTKTHIHV